MLTNLFKPATLGDIPLQNHIVMASMSRCRADNEGLVPNAMMADYYRRRAAAGLILTEGTWPSREAIGFLNVPGIYSKEQVAGWRQVTDAVHAAGGKIFSQLGHLGAVSHPDHQGGKAPLAPSAVNPDEKTFIASGFVDTLVPREMTVEDIHRTVSDFRKASENAKEAGFDGVEIHGAYLYLIPEFLNSATNLRTDEYGGSPEKRSRFVLEVVEAVSSVWEPHRVGIKLSPGLISGRVSANADTEATYDYLVDQLNRFDLAYLHGWRMPAPENTAGAAFNDLARYLRKLYRGTLMMSGGYTQESGEKALRDGEADFIAFATPFVANPDLVARFRDGLALAEPRQEFFYGGGAQGYIDYPSYVD